MNISWYSPLDAATSEIARYSAQLLPLLQEFATVAAVDDGSGAASAPWWQPEPGRRACRTGRGAPAGLSYW